MKGLRTICIVCALLLVMAGFGYSQAVNATLLGTVTDSSGAVVPSAKVTVTEVNTGVNRSGQTNESGNYTFPDLPPGQYMVTVETSGFKKETRKDITLAVNSSTRIDVQLTPGNVTETVEVTGAPPLLQTDRADTGAQLEVVQTATLPLGTNRNYQSLLNLVPGTAPGNGAAFAILQRRQVRCKPKSTARCGRATTTRSRASTITSAPACCRSMIPPIEAIQTVDVSTSNHDPELGRASGRQ